MNYRERYRTKLPHIQPIGETFFVTTRLHGSLPQSEKIQLTENFELRKKQLETSSNLSTNSLRQIHQQYFTEFDDLLHKTDFGPHWLKFDEIASVVAQSIHFWDSKAYELIAYCIMSNHIHLLFHLYECDADGRLVSLDRIMHSIKSFTANQCNRLLGRTGSFWEHESYDRQIRDRLELYHTTQYILNNPVKAGLCSNWKTWKWAYINENYDEFS